MVSRSFSFAFALVFSLMFLINWSLGDSSNENLDDTVWSFGGQNDLPLSSKSSNFMNHDRSTNEQFNNKDWSFDAQNDSPPPYTILNVLHYGASADGKFDNTEAFLRVWNVACQRKGDTTIYVPHGRYRLGSVRFKGPCNGDIIFLLRGILKADPNMFFTDTWIGFSYVNNLVIEGDGSGTLDGQGSAAWECLRTSSNCHSLPVNMRLDSLTNSIVQNFRSINSKNTHFHVFGTHNLTISGMMITAPEDSPNTDGIRIGVSTNITISRSLISTGDDCISILAGAQNLDVSDVFCGPGHGISIGGLGQTHANEDVKGINVQSCKFNRTQNGVRIKTWAPSLTSLASDINFEDLTMENVRNPIIIDQHYCPLHNCDNEVESRVQIRNVTFKNIRGTSESKVAVTLTGSGLSPCQNVDLVDIDLAYNDDDGPAVSSCSHVFGSSQGKQVPPSCIPRLSSSFENFDIMAYTNT